MIKRLKFAYELYNFFHKKDLIHNSKLYKKFGLNKKYFSSISSEDFKHINADNILKEIPNKKLEDIEYFSSLSEKEKESVRSFDELGYCLIPNFIDRETVNKINEEIEHLLQSGKIKFKYGNKLMFAIHQSTFLAELWKDHPFKPLLNHLIKGKAELFQSINFINGSEQKTHSDSIHMTTFPLGGLLGVWAALEKITEDCGPIHYYPKSHKLPYYLNKDYDNIGSRFFLGTNGYSAYEDMIEEKIKEQNLEKKTFLAEPGDLFIWHANLLHGGNPHTNKMKTRKSMVMHYFDARRICYHEITQRPALIKKQL